MAVSSDNGVIEVAFVASIFSALGALFILLNWMCVRSSRIFFLKLIVYLCIANLLSSASYIMAFVDTRPSALHGPCADAYSGKTVHMTDETCAPSVPCVVQAGTLVVFETASVLWTIAIAFTLHQQVVAKRADVERLEPWYHLLCWGVTVAIAVALLCTDRLGPADDSPTAWCWIRGVSFSDTQHEPTIEHLVQVGAFYAPLAVAFVYNLLT